MTDQSLPRIIVVGGGGHAKVVIEVIRSMNLAQIVGVLDLSAETTDVLGVPVLGGDEQLKPLYDDGVRLAAIALGDNRLRERVGRKALQLGYELPTLIHASAVVSPSASLGAGAVVMARAVIGSASSIGELAIVNTGAVVDHDNSIGVGVHIAPGCALAGNVTVDQFAFIGIGTCARQWVTIGAGAVVGAGSVLVRDVGPGTTVVGAPAAVLKRTSR